MIRRYPLRPRPLTIWVRGKFAQASLSPRNHDRFYTWAHQAALIDLGLGRSYVRDMGDRVNSGIQGEKASPIYVLGIPKTGSTTLGAQQRYGLDAGRSLHVAWATELPATTIGALLNCDLLTGHLGALPMRLVPSRLWRLRTVIRHPMLRLASQWMHLRREALPPTPDGIHAVARRHSFEFWLAWLIERSIPLNDQALWLSYSACYVAPPLGTPWLLVSEGHGRLDLPDKLPTDDELYSTALAILSDADQVWVNSESYLWLARQADQVDADGSVLSYRLNASSHSAAALLAELPAYVKAKIEPMVQVDYRLFRELNRLRDLVQRP